MQRDATKITLWLDNCSAQNKNWSLFCFFVYIINSNEIEAKTIELKYFEPGHTFMSANSFHHQVERSLKKRGKVYDFEDFRNCVQGASSGKTVVAEMEIKHFFDWSDYTSQHKLSRIHHDLTCKKW